MPNLDFILPHVLPLMLVVARLTGLFVFTPMLSSSTVPRSFRVLLSFMFAIAIYPFVPPFDPNASVDTITLVPLLFAELLIGVAIGLIAALPLLAVQMGGYIMGYQIGLSLAESFNPELEANGSAVGDLIFYLAIMSFIGLGGLELLFATMADSFRAVPIGMFTAGDTPLELFVGVLGSGFDMAIRVATPVMAVVSMLMVAMGFVMKTMPQINIMTVGFSAQIVCGLMMLLVCLAVISNVADDEMRRVMDAIAQWLLAAGGAHGR